MSLSNPATSSHPAYNPFFDTIRQNTGSELSHGITEHIPLRLPRCVRRRILHEHFSYGWYCQFLIHYLGNIIFFHLRKKMWPISPSCKLESAGSSYDSEELCKLKFIWRGAELKQRVDSYMPCRATALTLKLTAPGKGLSTARISCVHRLTEKLSFLSARVSSRSLTTQCRWQSLYWEWENIAWGI
jgi:hypothetical protein